MHLFSKPNVESLKNKNDVNSLVDMFLHTKDFWDGVKIANAIAAVNNDQRKNIKDPKAKDTLFIMGLQKRGIGNGDWGDLAFEVLGMVGDEQSITRLINEAKTNPDYRIRLGAIVALGYSGDPKVMDLLFSLLADTKNYTTYSGIPDWQVDNVAETRFDYAAIEALSRAKDVHSITPLLKKLQKNDVDKKHKDLIINTLIEIGEPAINDLIALLPDGSETLREDIFSILSKIGSPMGIDPLIMLFNSSKDKDLHLSISTLLAKIGDERVVDILIGVLKNKDGLDLEEERKLNGLSTYKYRNARMLAAAALGRIGDPRAIKPLNEAVKNDYDPTVKTNASEALNKFKQS